MTILLFMYAKFDIITSFIYSLFTYFIFFSFYEIGSMINDLQAQNEKEPTKRIRRDTTLNLKANLFSRIIFFIFLSVILPYLNLNLKIFIIFMTVTLLISIVHTYSKQKIKYITFTILRILKEITPIILLVPIIDIFTACFITIILFIMDLPKGIVMYYCKKEKKEYKITDIQLIIWYLLIFMIIQIIEILFDINYIFTTIPLYFVAYKLIVIGIKLMVKK